MLDQTFDLVIEQKHKDRVIVKNPGQRDSDSGTKLAS